MTIERGLGRERATARDEVRSSLIPKKTLFRAILGMWRGEKYLDAGIRKCFNSCEVIVSTESSGSGTRISRVTCNYCQNHVIVCACVRFISCVTMCLSRAGVTAQLSRLSS
jgi:hypothetical protein